MTGMRVRVIPKGPVLIPGPVRIEVPDGRVVESDRFMVAICGCGRSKQYPLCDTSHRRCRVAEAVAPEANSTAPATTADPGSNTP
ncbi:CDGSH iron-sulfur domain-containing protein [Mycobacterium numidiamassiliense]|uniref:CDGSH iron-sulfur domain-containing protein n=1 Tax=Mycobacterium numidiamassiliense TaxID=1841861 RepID=UPI00097D7A16|nr:CDGSH iron-sulfur domain-containing protein [Mycobacterium numidiamassiliense]